MARDLRLGLGTTVRELLTEINIALLHAMGGDIDAAWRTCGAACPGFESAGDQVGMGATLTVPQGRSKISLGETRAAREMYARAAKAHPVAAAYAGWQRFDGGRGLSNRLDDPRRAEREIAKAAAILTEQCIVAGRQLAALRGR